MEGRTGQTGGLTSPLLVGGQTPLVGNIGLLIYKACFVLRVTFQ